jgi:hypothetical protein
MVDTITAITMGGWLELIELSLSQLHGFLIFCTRFAKQ